MAALRLGKLIGFHGHGRIATLTALKRGEIDFVVFIVTTDDALRRCRGRRKPVDAVFENVSRRVAKSLSTRVSVFAWNGKITDAVADRIMETVSSAMNQPASFWQPGERYESTIRI